MGSSMPCLRGTPTHVTAIELYLAHHSDSAGVCVRCGAQAPCPVRQHAAYVIATTGEDPRWYDGRLNVTPPTSAPGSRPAASEVDSTSANHFGYTVSGRARPLSPEGYLYEREQ